MSQPDVTDVLAEVAFYAREIISRIGRYDISQDSLSSDASHADMLLMPLCQIGEIVQRNRGALTDAFPDMPWHQMAGLRNVIVHGYASLDGSVVWETVTRDVPRLIAFCEERLGRG